MADKSRKPGLSEIRFCKDAAQAHKWSASQWSREPERMTAVQKNIAMVMVSLLLSCAAAQNTASTMTVQNIAVTRDGTDLRIEVDLSSAVTPSVETAIHPDRILLDFPDTICGPATQKIVNMNGVRRVRTAQHSTNPALTRVVLDLDQAHPYILKSEGNRVTVIVSPAQGADEARRVAPAAATSGSLAGIFRRRQQTAVPVVQDNLPELPVPPATSAENTPSTHIGSSAPIPSSAQQAAPVPASVDKEKSASVSAEVFPSPKTAPVAPEPAEDRESAKIIEPPAVIASPAPASTAPALTMTIARSDDPSLLTVFRVKYVAEGVAYLEGGRAQGLAEGMKLVIEDSSLPAKQGDSVDIADPRVVAELEVTAVAETSSVTDIHTPKRPVKSGRPGLPVEQRCRSSGATARHERDAAVSRCDLFHRRRHAG